VRHKITREIKRVQVTFSSGQWELIERFRGMMGDDDAEIIRSIVVSWLSEKSVITSEVKEKGRGNRIEQKI
jgi:hypothetical protein